MVQVLKDSVRDKITQAAESEFAEVGFKSATVEAIARKAGVATGTVYKYFPNKKALFQSIITDDFVEELAHLTRSRIASFAKPDGLDAGQNPMEGESGDLLRFFVHNRLKVVILLGWGKGTKYEDFVPNYIHEMELQTMNQAQEQFPQLKRTQVFRFMVRKSLTESIRGIVSILQEFTDEKSIHAAFTASVGYQLAGINALVNWALSAEQPS